MEKDNKNTVSYEHYSNAPGTGVLSSMIFMIVTIVIMFVLSIVLGN